jgi:hypothetical protein
MGKGVKIAILSILLISIFLIGCAPSQEKLETLASCLTEKGAVMYGAYWCSHCQEQKERFGAAFAKVTYVECEVQKQKCADDNIKGLPTWKFADGSSLSGAQEFSVLAKKAGCEW